MNKAICSGNKVAVRTGLIAVRRAASRLLCAGLVAVAATTAAAASFTVSGNQVLDPNGKAFVMRGINFPFSWYLGNATQGFADVAATRANTIRVVLNSGNFAGATRTPGSEVSRAIQLCKNNRLVCVLEVHDATGWGDDSKAARLTTVAAYWTSPDIAQALKGQESWVILNIANEPVGNNQVSTWLADTQAAIRLLRNAGLPHLLMVDAPNWGQDWQKTMLNNAKTVFQGDTLKRTVFSVHMYESWTTYSAVRGYLDAFKATGTALVIGEFGPQHNGKTIDAAGIMKAAAETGVGYLGWSWSGNNAATAALDLVTGFGGRQFTSWGQALVYGCHGIGATAQLASHYSATPVVTLPTTQASCNWYGNSFPLCTQTTVGTWGWENNASCVVKAACSAQPSPYGVSGGTAVCPTTPPTVTQACNWYGNLYPLCSTQSTGWGWENNASCVGRNSCAALPAPYGVINQPTQCNWYGNTYPLCKTQSTGWGWENNASCVGISSCAGQPPPYGPK